MSADALKIVLYKTYEDRRGKRWVLLTYTRGITYPWFGRDELGNAESFTEDGRWSNYTRYHFDLVREIVEQLTEVAA